MSARRSPSFRTVCNATLGVVLLVLAAIHLVARPDPGQRNFEFLPEMLESVPYESQDANPLFADGKNLRTPAPGTIARGYPPVRLQATPEDAVRAGEELKSPLSADDEGDRTRGAHVYETFCQTCHDVAGAGRGVVTTRGMPPPPSLLAENALNMKDGQMFHVLTFGQGNMASYASQVEPLDRWRVILHVRSLQEKGR